MKKILEIIFLIWIFLLFILMAFSKEANNFTIIAATTISGATTFLVWTNKKYLAEKINKWQVSKKIQFILLGSLGALGVEFLYWFFEKVFDGQGLAVSSNLFYDWIVTMPWYVLMLFIFWQVLKKYNYSIKEILFFGGIYQVGADGLLNSILNNSFPQQFLTGLLAFPVFVVTYSTIVFIPVFLVKDFSTSEENRLKKYVYALLPLVGLPFYFIFIKLVFG